MNATAQQAAEQCIRKHHLVLDEKHKQLLIGLFEQVEVTKKGIYLHELGNKISNFIKTQKRKQRMKLN